MTMYKIREIAMILKDGEAIGKKMVLKSDEQQNEEPRVTVWNDHPECADAVVGGTISGVMEKKDSGTPIPGRQGNYINRTLLPEGSNTAKIVAGNLEVRVKKLEDAVFPNEADSQRVKGGETEDVNPDDIPF